MLRGRRRGGRQDGAAQDEGRPEGDAPRHGEKAGADSPWQRDAPDHRRRRLGGRRGRRGRRTRRAGRHAGRRGPPPLPGDRDRRPFDAFAGAGGGVRRGGAGLHRRRPGVRDADKEDPRPGARHGDRRPHGRGRRPPRCTERTWSPCVPPGPETGRSSARFALRTTPLPPFGGFSDSAPTSSNASPSPGEARPARARRRRPRTRGRSPPSRASRRGCRIPPSSASTSPACRPCTTRASRSPRRS